MNRYSWKAILGVFFGHCYKNSNTLFSNATHTKLIVTGAQRKDHMTHTMYYIVHWNSIEKSSSVPFWRGRIPILDREGEAELSFILLFLWVQKGALLKYTRVANTERFLSLCWSGVGTIQIIFVCTSLDKRNFQIIIIPSYLCYVYAQTYPCRAPKSR